MISDVKRAKFTQYFEATDMDGDGKVTKSDYLSSADKVIAVLKLDPASSPAQLLKANYAQTWDNLVKGSDREEFVTADWWIEHFSRIGSDGAYLDAYVAGRANAILQLFDADRDQHISKEEWTVFFSTIGHPERHYETGFQKLDQNHDGLLASDDIKTAAREFFASDDPGAIGNWMFGDYTRHLRA
jgi:Ca2+-binding EF-hand superfamily protein